MEQIKEVLKCPSPTRSCWSPSQSCSLSMLGWWQWMDNGGRPCPATLPAAFSLCSAGSKPSTSANSGPASSPPLSPQSLCLYSQTPHLNTFTFRTSLTQGVHFSYLYNTESFRALPWFWQQSCSLHHFMPHPWLLNPIPPWKRTGKLCQRKGADASCHCVCISSSHSQGGGWMRSW